MSGAVYENRPVVEEATRAGWRSWKPPPKGAPCAGLDPHPRRQPVLARGCASRRARPGTNAYQSPRVIRLLGRVGVLRKVAYERDGAGRLPLRGDVNSAVIGVSLAETAETPRRLPAVANVSAPRPDWRSACGNCGNSLAGSKR
jgi:hypothetical protein